MATDAPNWQFGTGVAYKLGDRGTGAWGVKPLPNNVEVFEGFEATPVIIFGDNGSNAPWFVDTQFAHEGVKSFRSGGILNNQFSDATALIPGGPNLSFWYKVSSEENFDYFEFYMDADLIFQSSGEVDWTFFTIPVGSYVDFTFRFFKDSSSIGGFDAVWVDEVQFGDPPLPPVYWPLKIDENDALVVNGVDIGIRPLTCDVDSVTICPGDDPIIVSATDLDIRPLTCATDSVTVCVDEPLDVNITGSVNLNVVISDVYNPVSVFYAPFGEHPLTTAADSATGGRLWLINDSPNILIIIREVRFTCVVTSLVDLGTSLPVVNMERMTFTGAPSGAQIIPAKRDSLNPSNVGTLRTANTGMVITPGAVIRRFAPPNLSVIGGLLSANTALSTPTEQVFEPQDRRLIVLRDNEGVVFRQATAGNATEGRFIMINLIWEEVAI